MHHPAGQWAGVVDLDRVAQARQMIGGGQAARAGTNDQHALAAWRGVDRERPSFVCGQIAEKALDGVDADCAVELLAIALVFARVVADPAVHGRQRIVADERLPSLAIAVQPAQGEPSLDVLAGRAGMIAGRQEIDIDRTARAHRSGARLRDQVDDRREI